MENELAEARVIVLRARNLVQRAKDERAAKIAEHDKYVAKAEENHAAALERLNELIDRHRARVEAFADFSAEEVIEDLASGDLPSTDGLNRAFAEAVTP